MHEHELYHGQSKKSVVEARALKELEQGPEHASRHLEISCQDFDPEKMKAAPQIGIQQLDESPNEQEAAQTGKQDFMKEQQLIDVRTEMQVYEVGLKDLNLDEEALKQ